MNGNGARPDAGRIGLVLSGGGARGAYEAGVMSVLAPALAARGERASIYIGTSVGAVNAAYMAASEHLPADEAHEGGLRRWREAVADGLRARGFRIHGDEQLPRLAERGSNMGVTLSGGEQQMLAIGRALMTNPRLLILDEATEGLAPKISREIWSIIGTIKQAGIGAVIVDKNFAAVSAIADRVARAFSEPYSMGGADHFVTASIGIAVARPAGCEPIDPELLIRDADAAMYRAKERGRGRCEVFDAAMRARAVRRLETERELRHALDRDELELHYQPVVALGSGEIVGLEALVRWDHPERGLLDPGEFVSIAEDSGLIEPIGRWVQERACMQTLKWHAQRPDQRPLDISVNLSARQVAHRDLAESVTEILSRTGLDPIHLRLEITESVLVGESAKASATLKALSEIGVHLVLDDFGTGYSSLAYLNRFPFDALKIDRSFIDGLGVEQDRTAIVEAIIGMARALSLDVIAEGLESEPQLSELRRLRCDFAQGHLFSPALPPEKITSLLSEGGLKLLGDAAR